MANLTGEYDVATELSLGLVNCVLAAMHENEDNAYPRLLHSLTLRVNDVYKGAADPVPEAERTGVRTRAEVQVSTPTVSFPMEGVADPIWSRSRAPLRTALGRGPAGFAAPGARPTCWPRITARFRIRAWLRDAPQQLPEFLHGDVHITAGLVRTELGPRAPAWPRAARAGTFLGFDYSSGPDVRFEPAAGTTVTAEQRALAERVLRNYIRGDSEGVSFKLDLPAEVKRFDYKLLPSGPRPSAMLMVTLDSSPVGTPEPGSVSTRFLPGGADFAVAIGRDHLLGTLRRELLQGLSGEPTGSGPLYSYRVRPDWPSATFDLQPGRIVFSVSGSGTVTYGAGWLKTTDEWSFTIRVPVTLHVVAGLLRPALAADPEVDLHDVAVFEGTIREEARDAVKAEFQSTLEAALAPAPDGTPSDLAKALEVGRQLEDIIAALHPSPAGVALTGVDIRPEGIVVPGTVALAPSRPVEVRRASLGGLDDALESWIPGGTIERFVWGSHAEAHRFVSEQPMFGVAAVGRCLTVEGTRVTHGGGVVPVSAEDCPTLVATLPVVPGLPTRRRPLLPLLGAASEGRLDVVGHYDPWASGRVPSDGPTNLLVHFAGDAWADSEEALEKALGATKKRNAALVVVGVLGRAGLEDAVGATLGSGATLLLTEDPEGNWAAALGAPKAPATVLVGPDGQVRWKDEAALDRTKLGRALDKHLEEGGAVSWHALSLAVAASDQAPDVPLRLVEGRELALRRLRGGSAVLSFWTSSSEPSVEQLRQLGEAVKSGRAGGSYVLGIGDGESQQQVDELAEREQLPFLLVPDPARAIARRYGVSSWPATVQVGPEGRVVAADIGLVPGLSPCERPSAVGIHPAAVG